MHKVENSIVHLYLCDYRVRIHIRKCLEELYRETQNSSILDAESNIAFQLALCYYIGFGVRRDEEKANCLLKQHNLNHSERPRFERVVARIGEQFHILVPISEAMGDLEEKGHLPETDISAYYMEQDNLENAVRWAFQELEDLKLAFSVENSIIQIAKSSLYHILKRLGRLKEAEDLALELFEHETRANDDGDEKSFICTKKLAMILFDQKRWDEAEKLQAQVLKHSRETYGNEHSLTMLEKTDLAAIYAHGEQWDKAEKLYEEVLNHYRNVLGAANRTTLIGMNNLAMVYSNRKRWKEAEKIWIDLIEIPKKNFGLLGPEILGFMNNLATYYVREKRWEEAEELCLKVLKVSKTVCGAGHPETAQCMIICQQPILAKTVGSRQFN
jgi:tetratricopeptide (TPR) repeat protein